MCCLRSFQFILYIACSLLCKKKSAVFCIQSVRGMQCKCLELKDAVQQKLCAMRMMSHFHLRSIDVDYGSKNVTITHLC